MPTCVFWAAFDEISLRIVRDRCVANSTGRDIASTEVTVDVIGPAATETIQALVDTGSDETVFPASLADTIGVRLDHSSAGKAAAVGGHAVELVPGSVILQIARSGQEFRWETKVSFLATQNLEEEVALLGYAGFLEFFRATFDSEKHELELTPNSMLRDLASARFQN
jgi:predicted aspartyl protease